MSNLKQKIFQRERFSFIVIAVLLVSLFTGLFFFEMQIENEKEFTMYQLRVEAYVLSPVSNVVVSTISDNGTITIEILDTIVSYNKLAGTYNITAVSTERYTVNQFDDVDLKFSGDFSRIIGFDATDFSRDDFKDSVWVAHSMTVGVFNIHVMLMPL